MDKVLIQREYIDDFMFDVEMISNPQSALFGKFGISAIGKTNFTPFLLLDDDTEVKDVCNCLLKANTISDIVHSNINELKEVLNTILAIDKY